MIEFRVLGTLEVHSREGGASGIALTQPKRVALLLYLALAEPPGPKSRDSLMALLWPEADDESARHSLRNTLYGLRQALGDDAFVSRGEGYVGLELSAVGCDALEVRRLLTEHRWQEATAAWGGDIVPGFHVSGAPEFEQWLEDQRTSLRRAVTAGAWRWVDELERSGDVGVVRAAQRACALEPGNEAGARRLIRFLDASVGRAAALRAYDDLADYLRRELEADPSAETRSLAEEIRTRIEPPLFLAARAPAGAAQDPATSDAVADLVRTDSPARRRSAALAGIVGALLMAGAISVFALRPVRSPPLSASEAAKQAGRDSVLRLPMRYRQDTASYSSYLRALKLRLDGSTSEARDTFAALVEREPLYVPALSGLAHAYALMIVGGAMPPAEGWPKVEAAAKKALALDSTSGSAYLALGASETFWHWDLRRAGELIDRGLALEPSDPEAHAIRGAWFCWKGEPDSAVVEARTSYRLDPLNPHWTRRLARQLYFARKYAEAESAYRGALRDYPRDRVLYDQLSFVYRAMGRPKDALATFLAGIEASGETASEELRAKSDSQAARVLEEWPRRDLSALTERVRAGDAPMPEEFAHAYAGVRNKDSTLYWLDSMVRAHSPRLWAVPLEPVFDFLKGDPQYIAWEANLPWRQPRR